MESSGDSRATKQTQGKEVSTRSKSLETIYTNAQSIVNKIDELRSVACDLKPDVILINESWTHSDITKAYLTIDGYELVSREDRLDTSNGRGEGNTIDLVLSSNDIAIASVEDAGSLGKSHHSIIRVKVDTQPSTTFSTEKVPDYKNADFRKMNEFMASVDWSERLQPLNTLQSWDLFKNTLTDGMNACIPQKDRRTSDQPLWMNQIIMRILRKKR